MNKYSSVASKSSSKAKGRLRLRNVSIDSVESFPNLISLSMLANADQGLTVCTTFYNQDIPGSFCLKTCVRPIVCSIEVFHVAASNENLATFPLSGTGGNWKKSPVMTN